MDDGDGGGGDGGVDVVESRMVLWNINGGGVDDNRDSGGGGGVVECRRRREKHDSRRDMFVSTKNIKEMFDFLLIIQWRCR